MHGSGTILKPGLPRKMLDVPMVLLGKCSTSHAVADWLASWLRQKSPRWFVFTPPPWYLLALFPSLSLTPIFVSLDLLSPFSSRAHVPQCDATSGQLTEPDATPSESDGIAYEIIIPVVCALVLLMGCACFCCYRHRKGKEGRADQLRRNLGYTPDMEAKGEGNFGPTNKHVAITRGGGPQVTPEMLATKSYTQPTYPPAHNRAPSEAPSSIIENNIANNYRPKTAAKVRSCFFVFIFFRCVVRVAVPAQAGTCENRVVRLFVYPSLSLFFFFFSCSLASCLVLPPPFFLFDAGRVRRFVVPTSTNSFKIHSNHSIHSIHFILLNSFYSPLLTRFALRHRAGRSARSTRNSRSRPLSST